MLNHILETKGLAAAYDAACAKLRTKEAELNALWDSRFFEMRELQSGAKKLWPVTEAYVGRCYDDDDAEARVFLYCDEAGGLHPVSVGRQARNDLPEKEDSSHVDVYAHACLLANNKVVGHVAYTDH